MKIFLILIGLIFFVGANAAEFWSIEFDAWVGETTTATVGKTVSLPVYVKNNGVLEDSYTVSTTSDPANNVFIENPSFTIGPVKYGEVKSLSLKITFLVAADSNMTITVNSTTSPSVNWSKTLQIKGGLASMPEFDFFGVIQIMVLVFVLLILKL